MVRVDKLWYFHLLSVSDRMKTPVNRGLKVFSFVLMVIKKKHSVFETFSIFSSHDICQLGIVDNSFLYTVEDHFCVYAVTSFLRVQHSRVNLIKQHLYLLKSTYRVRAS